MTIDVNFDPVYPCKVCKVSRPMAYTPELSHGEMPEGLDLLTCHVCRTSQVRDQAERLVMASAIRRAWDLLADDLISTVDNPVDNFAGKTTTTQEPVDNYCDTP